METTTLTAEGLRAHLRASQPALFASEGSEARPSFRSSQEAPKAPKRPNKFAGKCSRCQGRVEAEAGYIEPAKVTHGTPPWLVFHVECPDEAVAPKPVSKARVALPASDWTVALEQPLPEGRFTVVFDDGEHRTIRVRRQSEDARFMPGQLILSYLSGPNNDSDYLSFANARAQGVKVWQKFRNNSRLIEAVRVLVGDPITALKAYGLRSGTCGVCGRTLTTPESIAAGIGPVCQGRL